ncbi:hypothetical protein Tco_1360526 [Tanacetum coccineum]
MNPRSCLLGGKTKGLESLVWFRLRVEDSHRKATLLLLTDKVDSLVEYVLQGSKTNNEIDLNADALHNENAGNF